MTGTLPGGNLVAAGRRKRAAGGVAGVLGGAVLAAALISFHAPGWTLLLAFPLHAYGFLGLFQALGRT